VATNTPDPESMGRARQFIETYKLTKRSDPRIGLWLIGAFVLAGAVGFAIFTVLPGTGLISWILSAVAALMFGLLAALILFGRRAQKAAYAQMEGQPGAAAAALKMLRRGWRTDPAIGVTRQQDVIHRVVGPPGIVLIGEGNPNRLRQLMNSEHKKHERVAAGAPVREVMVGHDEAAGQVALPKLVRHVQKLGKEVKPAEMTDILNRLKALDAQRAAVPIPKGPMPTSMKGLRGNLRGR
jgi:Domain of unknown function (DUF4191)